MDKINRIPTAEEFLNQFYSDEYGYIIHDCPNEEMIAYDRELLEALLEAAQVDHIGVRYSIIILNILK
nr:hypothetical protein [Frisingicoccus sp.]